MDQYDFPWRRAYTDPLGVAQRWARAWRGGWPTGWHAGVYEQLRTLPKGTPREVVEALVRTTGHTRLQCHHCKADVPQVAQVAGDRVHVCEGCLRGFLETLGTA